MVSKPRKIVTKIIVFILFGLLIISFVVWGVGDILRTPSQDTVLAEVGDIEIEEREFRRNLSRELNRLSARLGRRLDIQQAEARGIVDQVFGQLIGRALFDQKAKELGMLVTKSQIGQRIANEPAFQNTLGEFSPDRFAQALQISNLGEQEYVNNLTQDIIRQQLVGAVTGAVAVPSQLAEKLFRYQQERRVAQVMTIPLNSITDLGVPDETALAEIHKQQSSQFMAPEFRRVSFARLRAEDLLSEVAVPETELRNEYESRRGDFDIQERRTIEQIVLPDEATARQVEDQLKGGTTFAAAAEAATGQPPVDLGAVEKDDLPPELADATFAAAPDAVTAPVQSPLGWHIVKVTSVEPGRERSFEDVRDELAQDVGMRLAVDSMISIANQLDDSLGGGATLEEASRALGLEIRQIDAVDRQGNGSDGQPAAGLPGEPFLEIVFDTAAGSDSLLTESNDGGYFVLRTESIEQARLRPLAEVREQVTAQWRNRQRAERAAAKAQELAESLRSGAEFADVAAKAGLITTVTEPLTRFDSRAPNNPAASLPGKLFQLRPGEITTAQALEGHIVAKLDKIIPADPTRNPEDLADVQDGVASALQNDLLEQFAAALRARYGVTINDRMVENTLANF
ncbi:MAG: SurA N-terminal domain-containing protein [Alphaproteobacteria bacterium]